MSGPVYDQREALYEAGRFDQRPGDLEATRQAGKAMPRLAAQMGMREGKGVVVLRRGADSIATLDPGDAYRLAEALAEIADIIGHDARRDRD